MNWFKNADNASTQGETDRAQYEDEELSRRTVRGLTAARAPGAKFGNPRNLPDAQRKGAAANRKAATLRRAEFQRLFEKVQGGASNAKQIAGRLNELGHLTARGQLWTGGTVYRQMRKCGLKLTKRSSKPVEDYDRHALSSSPLYGTF